MIPTWPNWVSYVILYGFAGYLTMNFVRIASRDKPFSAATRKVMQIEAFLFWPLLLSIFVVVYVCTFIRTVIKRLFK
jgi:hypothetical protein